MWWSINLPCRTASMRHTRPMLKYLVSTSPDTPSTLHVQADVTAVAISPPDIVLCAYLQSKQRVEDGCTYVQINKFRQVAEKTGAPPHFGMKKRVRVHAYSSLSTRNTLGHQKNLGDQGGPTRGITRVSRWVVSRSDS